MKVMFFCLSLFVFSNALFASEVLFNADSDNLEWLDSEENDSEEENDETQEKMEKDEFFQYHIKYASSLANDVQRLGFLLLNSRVLHFDIVTPPPELNRMV